MSAGARRISDDRGAVAVTVALFIVVVVSLAAFVVDVGYMYDVRRQLQSAADAAALAGCQALIETESEATAESVARAYVAKNQVRPATDISIQSVYVDSGEGSVRVAVEQDTQQFFSQVFGPSSRSVAASAKARKWKVIGARYVMPWGIPIILDEDIERIDVTLRDDGRSVVSGPATLGQAGARTWSGYISVPSGAAPAEGAGYDLYASIFNIFGVEEQIGDSSGAQPLARLMVPGSAYPFETISITQDYPASDEQVAITVHVTTVEAAPGVSVKIDGRGRSLPMAGSGTSWSITLGQGDLGFSTDAFMQTYALDISVGGADRLVDAYVHVRRATHPVSRVEVTSEVLDPGATAGVTLRLNEFDPAVLVPGRVYPLKVGSTGVETGNFGELNYNGIQHDTEFCLEPCPGDPPGVDLGNNVREWVQSGYAGGIHIGDIIPLSPGNSGWTDRVVDERIAKYGNFVVLPVVTKYQEKAGGSYDVIVRKFAAFRIVDIEGDSIWGEFVAYAANPAAFAEDPEGPVGVVYAARLVNP